MEKRFSIFLDQASEFIARRKGLLPLLGISLILVNFLLQIIPMGWLSQSNLFLHLGIILAILGLMFAWAL
jgi:hypothetical protein